MRILLVSTYEIGRQPFGIASPAAWLRGRGHSVTCLDLAVEPLQPQPVREAELIAFHVPMHTATRLAADLVEPVRRLNPAAHICFYGLYAPMNEAHLRKLGAQTIIGGEFEPALADLAERLAAARPPETPASSISLARIRFEVPDRTTLPALTNYARLEMAPGDRRTVGYTEATRGCKHLCRHCPVVPVYQGRFRVVQEEVVLEDIRRQVQAGAEHITFGDPDFLNGPRHALSVAERLHREFPELTYNVTIKVEHLLRHRAWLPVLRDTGCLFVTSAVESIDDEVLRIFDKQHTYEDFVEAVRICSDVGLRLDPTFVTFTPWTSLADYLRLLEAIVDLGLVDDVASIQLGIRLLIPASSKLLELETVTRIAGAFDPDKLVHPWEHEDPRVDRLTENVLSVVQDGTARKQSRRQIFESIWKLTREACEAGSHEIDRVAALDQAPPAATIPFLTEPWYC